MNKRFRVIAAIMGVVAALLIVLWLMPHTVINFFTEYAEYGEAKEVRWHGLAISFGEGEIVLPKVTDTELIIRRKAQDALLMLNSASPMYAAKVPLIKALCAQINCSTLVENERMINGKKIRTVEYIYQQPDKTSMKEAYYWVNGSAIVLYYKGSNASFADFGPTIEKALIAISSAAAK